MGIAVYAAFLGTRRTNYGVHAFTTAASFDSWAGVSMCIVCSALRAQGVGPRVPCQHYCPDDMRSPGLKIPYKPRVPMIRLLCSYMAKQQSPSAHGGGGIVA
jgi:hypothetical protein